MNSLKIPENHSGVSKTLRLPDNIVEDVQNLATIKNLSFNKTVITLLKYSLDNLDENDKLALENMRALPGALPNTPRRCSSTRPCGAWAPR